MYVRNDIYLHEDQRVNEYFMQFMTCHKLSNDYHYYLRRMDVDIKIIIYIFYKK